MNEALKPLAEAAFPWLKSAPAQRKCDFSGVEDKDALNEFHRQAELCLEGTVKLALAADSRATTSTSIFSAAAAGSLVVSGNLAGAEHPHSVLIGAIVSAAVTLLIAAGYCALASRPIKFFVTGFEPDLLYEAADTERHIKQASAADIQMRIDANRFALRSAADILLRGQIIAVCAPIVFVIVFCLFYR